MVLVVGTVAYRTVARVFRDEVGLVILVDFREEKTKKGSPGLWEDLRKTTLPIERSTLDAGDLMFLGRGPEGKEVTVGLEFKKLRDLLQSLRTGRLQGKQLIGLQQYDFRYLLVEGEWRSDDKGMVTVRAGRGIWKPVPGQFRASELDKTLLGLPLRAGVLVWATSTRRDTIRWIKSLYRNWTDNNWKDHTSHVAVYRPPTLVPISDFRTTVTTFPGIGLRTSLLVESHFGQSIRRAVGARAKEWSKIDGVGVKTAERVDRYLE
jgi:ERCC4-type nuclease